MSSFTERLKIVIDVVSSGATRGLSDFRSEVAKADTATGKLRAGARSLNNTFSSFIGSPLGAATAIAAVTTAAIKAATKFSDLAKASHDLGTAVGMSTEEASRWIAVGDDFGLTAEDLGKSLAKIPKSLDAGYWQQLGIATRDAGGAARSTNDIFLDSLDVLNGMGNATERVATGQQIFGKGFAQIAPLLGKTREEYEALLASVSEAQVINEGEYLKAEKFRLSMDELGDSLSDVGTQLGEVAASLAPVISAAAQVIGPTTAALLDFTGIADNSSEAIALMGVELKKTRGNAIQTAIAFTGLADDAIEGKNVFEQFWFGLKNFGSSQDAETRLEYLKMAMEDLGEASPETAIQVVDAMRQVVEASANGDAAARALVDGYGLTTDAVNELEASIPPATRAVYEFNKAEQEAAQAERDAADAVKRHHEEMQRLLDLRRELYGDQRDAIERQRDYTKAQQETTEVLADADATLDQQIDSVIGLSEQYGTLNGATLNSREGTWRQIQRLQELQGTMKPGSPLFNAIGSYIKQLQLIPGIVETQLRLHTTGAVLTRDGDVIGLRSGARALGGPVQSDGMYQVGEGGKPELLTDAKGRTYLIPGSDGVVTPITDTGMTSSAGGGQTFNITITNPIVSGEQLANQLKAYIQRNGSGWLS